MSHGPLRRGPTPKQGTALLARKWIAARLWLEEIAIPIH